MKPLMAAASTATTDEQLVAALRAGSDEALEALFLRYRDRIAAYVRGIVSDQGKAEDIVQETFISALRSLRATDRPIAFRPWIYQIARNACIDSLRRQKRAQEVSLDSDDFNSQDERRISQNGPSTHGAVTQREDMHSLRQAFSALPDSQHEILVLRELEGLSYAEIASRMSISPAAVESMLFRARRGLKDEYDEISTGERCRRIHALIAAVAEGMGGVRDRQALGRHVRFCAACRREAMAMGLSEFVAEALRRGRIKRALHRAAALFPFPPFVFRRGGGGNGDASLLERVTARVQGPLANLGAAGGPAAEQAAGAVPKAVAVIAAAALIGGGGLVGQKSDGASASASPLSADRTALSKSSVAGLPLGQSLGGGRSAVDPFGVIGTPLASGPSPSGGTGAADGSTVAGQQLLGQAGEGLVGGSPTGGGGSGSGSLGDTVKSITSPDKGSVSLPKLTGGRDDTSVIDGGQVGSQVKQLEQKVQDNLSPVLPNSKSGSSQPKLPSVPSVPSTGSTGSTDTSQGSLPSAPTLSTDAIPQTLDRVQGTTGVSIPLP